MLLQYFSISNVVFNKVSKTELPLGKWTQDELSEADLGKKEAGNELEILLTALHFQNLVTLKLHSSMKH